MPQKRKVVLANGEIYHVFNRGVEKRNIFNTYYDYKRAINTLRFYQFSSPPIRLSHYINLNDKARSTVEDNLNHHPKLVRLHSYCLMPNHFHMLIEQLTNEGIAKYLSNFSNSYARYYNVKHDRVGPLYQGIFKAVHIDSDDMFLHVSRYIHINPTTSFLIKKNNLLDYPWSSLREFTGKASLKICYLDRILNHFSSPDKYIDFVLDQVDYARSIHQLPIIELEDDKW